MAYNDVNDGDILYEADWDSISTHTHTGAARDGSVLTWASTLDGAAAGDHDHSDNTEGGSTLAPTAINMAGNIQRATGAFVISAGDSTLDLTAGGTSDIDLNGGGDVEMVTGTPASDVSSTNTDFICITDCTYDLGYASPAWQDVHCDGAVTGSCDVAEFQWIIGALPSGTVVEMTDAPAGLIALRTLALAETNRLAEIRPAKHAARPFHKHHGLTSAWKIASLRSTKCVSVISKNPAMIMGATTFTHAASEDGDVKPVALSGSVQDVFIEGVFSVGDILVSAGNGKAMVDNDAPPNQWLGHAKENGEDAISEVWVK